MQHRMSVLLLASLLGGCQMLRPDYGTLPPTPDEDCRLSVEEASAEDGKGFFSQLAQSQSAQFFQALKPDFGRAPKPQVAREQRQVPTNEMTASQNEVYGTTSHNTTLQYEAVAGQPSPIQFAQYVPARNSVVQAVMRNPQDFSERELSGQEFAEAANGSETTRSTATPSESTLADILAPQSGDSEALRDFLILVKERGPATWQVERQDLAKCLEFYRSTVTPNMTAAQEKAALAMLSQWIFREDAHDGARENARAQWRATSNDTTPRQEDANENLAEELRERRLAKSAPSPTRRPARLPKYQDDQHEQSSQTLTPPKRLMAKTEWESDVIGLPDEVEKNEEYPHLPQLNGGNNFAQQKMAASSRLATGKNRGSSGVIPANYVQNTDQRTNLDGDWMRQARAAADMLRWQMEHDVTQRTFANEGRLRLLELTLGNRGEAVRSFSTLETSLDQKSFQEFWSNLMLGFSALLDESSHSKTQDRLLSVSYRLGEGGRALANLCPIQIKNPRIVQRVTGYAKLLPRTSEECHAGEKLLVYMELENPTVRRLAEGFGISVSFSYEIRNENGEILHKDSSPPDQEISLSRKRDYFGTMVIVLPDSLPTGNYHLRVCVNDMHSDTMQYAEEQIPFCIVPGSAAL